jgi:hypothetical protein
MTGEDRAMRQMRPGAVTAAAVICIIYGSLFSLCGLGSALSLAFQDMGGDPATDAVQAKMDEVRQAEVPAYKTYVIASVVLGLALTLLILIGGIGLLGMNHWARTVAILGCSCDILTSVLGSIYYIVWVYPATRKAFELMPADLAAKGIIPPPDFLEVMEMVHMAAEIGAVVVSLLAIIPLSIVIVLLTRPHVVQAFYNPLPDDLEDRVRDLEEDLEFEERRREYDDRGYDDIRDDPGRPDDRFR